MDESYCTYKLDMSKAYNRVDWVFLEKFLLKMGFNKQWVNWGMISVTTVRYRVKINGELTEIFSPARGLRQGDPLSPYLILFVGQALSLVLDRAVYLGELHDQKICRKALGISHLLFANDSLIFFKAKVEQAGVIKKPYLSMS